MKQLFLAGVAVAALLLSFGGCSRDTSHSSAVSSEESSAPVSSQPESSSDSDLTSSSQPDESEQVSTAAVKRELFTFRQNGKNYAVSYPVFLGLRNADLLNAAAKQAAMRDVEQNGYESEVDASSKQLVQINISTEYELTRQSGDFVSVLFITSYERSDASHPDRMTHSVNFDLRSGKELAVSDMLKEDEDLYEVIWEAVRDNAPPDIVSALPTESIQQKKADTSVYMTPDGVGFAIPLSYSQGDFYQIVVPYWEMKPFLQLEVDPLEEADLAVNA
ncbi:hypothetical protein [Clostridium minihomine]|uniref:hypothetical protein n=1 Tax=Clostridium minihomine TaxID=2045012 RepID=UPI000C76AB86|nr:hypothetical protein [Clostridium minihomine]